MEAQNQQTNLVDQVTNWPTPHGFQAGNGPSGNEYAAEVERWATPRSTVAMMGGSIRESAASRIADQAAMWQTPATDSFRSRGGDRRDEQGLDQQCRSFRLDRDWLAMAFCVDYGSFTGETLDALGDCLKLSGKTADGGPACWCGAPNCSQPSHKRRLNPLFASWEMGWPVEIGWSEAGEWTRCGSSEMALYLYRQRSLLWSLLGGE